MSTALWANVLINGKVDSDESDKCAIYKHSKKLDKITKSLNVVNFEATQDFTDMQYNMSDDLPEGMESTDELMAKKGVWVSGSDAVEMLEKVISHLSEKGVRFGLFDNDHEEIVRELTESLQFANRAKSENGMFNFSVVM
ncbi:hypothetical protein [Rhabdochromatium marinum]|uniref:hypothetical protein n=1 Tax=Rhabdochromatium marinum TaxID=48729 RepID=UPI00190432E7|nr:hypothetical protein [Rhabdochromatium marinum]MBK1647711.1 hypothetical protein [Rhabdochromatium marinum]